jgi:hypothetical protein
MWSRVAARGANLRRMANANEDSEDTRLTRGVVRSVMAKSRAGRGCEHPGGGAGASSSALADDGGSEDEMVCELEQEMSQGSSEAPEAPQGMLLLGFFGGRIRRIEEEESVL